MKWIELLKAVDGHKAGDFLEVEDNIARAYIDSELAKDGGDGPDVVLFQRSLDAFRTELRGMVEGTAKVVADATEGLRKTPRNVHIEPGEQEADRTKGIGNFVMCVVRANDPRDVEGMQAAHDRLIKVYTVKRVMTEGSGATGGYTTPELYETMILKESAEDAVYSRGATEIPLGARTVHYPALDQYFAPAAGQSAMFGGVQVYRKGETIQRTSTAPKYKRVSLTAQDLTAYFEISRDLQEDSTAQLDAQIPMLGGAAINWRVDWETQNGNGEGQFLGYLNAPATLFVTRNTSGHIKYQDVFTMVTKLLPMSRKRARWIAHPYSFNDILQLQDPSGRFIFIPNWPASQEGPIGQEPGGRLLGLPLEFSEKAPAPGNTGDLMLIDSSKFLHGRRSGLEVALSEHFKFDTDELAIRLKLRNDGQPWLKGPIYLADGSQSNQVSAFIALQ